MNNITIKTKIDNILEIIDEIKDNEKMNENNYLNICNLLKDIYNTTQSREITSILLEQTTETIQERRNWFLNFFFLCTNDQEFIG